VTSTFRRALALELLHLDELQQAFRDRALVDRDTAAAGRLTTIDK
jgi:hypothetical protein